MAIEVVKYSDLISRMARDLRGVSFEKSDAMRSLKDAGRKFCNESYAWYEPLTAIDVVADQQEYALTTAYPAQFKEIKSIRMLTESEVTAGDEGSLVDPAYYRLNLPATLHFNTGHIPVTAVTGGMVVKMVLVPQMDAEELPEWIISRWGEAIIGWAKYDMLRAFDIGKAMIFSSQYNDVLNQAMVESLDDIKPGIPGSTGLGIEIKEHFTP